MTTITKNGTLYTKSDSLIQIQNLYVQMFSLIKSAVFQGHYDALKQLFKSWSSWVVFPLLYNCLADHWSIRPLVKSAYQKNNFLISQPKHMLWVLKRTVSMRRFF